jgi:hypothetical protein
MSLLRLDCGQPRLIRTQRQAIGGGILKECNMDTGQRITTWNMEEEYEF